MLLTGATPTVSGQARLLPSSLLAQSGFTCQQTLFPSIMCSPVLRAASPSSSTLMVQMISTPLLTTGCMRSPQIKSGIYLRRCTDGSDGRTVPTCSSLTNPRPAGTGSPTVDLTQSPIPLTVNTLLNMFTTTTYTLMLMRSLAKLAAKRALLTVSSSP